MSDLFSGIQAAMVINRVENSEQSPEDWNSDCDGSGGSTGLTGTPCFTSRFSLLKVGSVIGQFSDFKRQLVRETGFDGMLELKSWQKISLKYIAYLMDRVDVDSSIINLEGQGVLELCDQHLNYVFGIPCGNSVIQGEGIEPSEACIEYTRVAASFSERGTHSLKAAEAYLIRDITESSPQIEQGCFKIAFVIFVVGHVLAPTAKHDYISIDFWAALSDISKIKDWNWGGYVLKNLFQAVKKFNADVSKRNPTVHIVGCHLFLQLFVLDSLDLGVLNMLRDVTLRIGLYEYDLMKKMVDKITVNVGASEVSYHGAMVRTELSVSNLIGFPSKETFTVKAAKPAPRRANATCAPMLRSSYTKTGPQEFSNYIRTRYPSISAEKLGILLREQNARGLASISEMRQVFQSNMFTFTDKLMACLADSCTCCKAHGNKKCILEKDGTNTCDAPPHVPTHQTQFSTPLVSKIGPRLPAPGNPVGCLSANSSAARKRDGSLSSSVQSGTAKKTCSREAQNVLAATPTYGQEPLNQIAISQDASLNEIASKIVAFYDNLTAILVTYYAEMRPAPGFILFGSTTDGAHVKIDLPQCNFGRDPWVAGSVPVPPNPTVLRAIRD
ncbi:uncharacterized protein LOC125530634 isoform X1 [Triticum urartu]|uniref:uncharacterized protein LOC125530634 isoform X1 n=1 Tax=Triticum urartu TaxID=4572 RepID=UPI0020449E56|nr:uncharacterized protein LOC125530634 isoform X1 [Triticum urartu]XP_048550973.1 uncharacterized protein LOC125530634 isoform X1 [Triticum urartu]XP_048550974.1 uncharacterized protein LOC125530634 isoform X1 [Triticum urartu]